ncbi:MAG: glycosyltransferase family 2 protein [Tannerella sp.]|jgi:glycosyltransferase involved in cell wall biosynthesis|nr:glycosyltransferase family 2 protein [Tannerella sp.]
MEITVVIHTLNSDAVLRQCLESVKEFDEIIVCDMYSTDQTLTIAHEYNCRIVMHKPCGGIPEPARAYAVGQAVGEWILVVDSDEVVPVALREYLYTLVRAPGSPDAWMIPRKNFFMQRFMHAAYPDYQLRFFRKEKFAGWPSTVHARPAINGIVRKAPKHKGLDFIHMERNDIVTTLTKMNRYTDRELDRQKALRGSVIQLVFKPFFKFLHLYFLKGGCRNGKAGFIFCTLKALYKYLFAAKVIERRRTLPSKRRSPDNLSVG